MDYTKKPKYHYRPEKGWVNDPNGLVFFKGYYHVFFQHAPHYELPWREPMHWGHARTKDFIKWETLPIALCSSQDYDSFGCWSGTAIVKENRLYLFYASVQEVEGEEERRQTVSVAYSDDGIHFTKYEQNPVIKHYPDDGCPDFRDPAVAYIDGKYYCVMASGHRETKTARLLLYKSDDLLDWEYVGIMCEWENSKFAECPSFVQMGDEYILTASVCGYTRHYFSIMYGNFEDGKFITRISGEVDKGPDQYAGQMFIDDKGRALLIAWTPGWGYVDYTDKDIGCMSLPRQLTHKNGRIYGNLIPEMQHLLKDSDDALTLTEDGFIIERSGREPVIHHGKIRKLKMLRDEYILEVFINDGEEIYTVLL